MSWIDELKANSFSAVANALAAAESATCTVEAHRNAAGPCPSCGATARGTNDGRKPVGVSKRHGGFECFVCGVTGDLIDLCALVLLGAKASELPKGGMSVIRTFAASAGLCSEDYGGKGGSGITVPSGAGFGAFPRHAKPAPDPDLEAWKAEPVPENTTATAPDVLAPCPAEEVFGWHPNLPQWCADRLEDNNPMAEHARGYLAHRGIPEATYRKWGIGLYVVRCRDNIVREVWITIPLKCAKTQEVKSIRYRAVPGRCGWCGGEGCKRCKGGRWPKIKYRVPKDGPDLPLFGTLPTEPSGTVTVLEGELDVIAADTYGVEAVSTTAGAGTFLEEWIDILEPFAGFNLGYDDDEKGRKGAAKLAKSLGLDRCSTLTLPEMAPEDLADAKRRDPKRTGERYKDMGECVQYRVSDDLIAEAIALAKPMVSTEITGAGAYRETYKARMRNPELFRGLQTISDGINTGLGGLLPGVYTFTAKSGAGKTTALTWLAWSMSKFKGVPSLLTSFENGADDSVDKLVRLEGDAEPSELGDAGLDQVFDDLDKLPISIVRHHGHLPFDQLVEALKYAARRLKVKIVVLDHLDYLIDHSVQDERRAKDITMRALATLGATLGIVIGLVCHPNGAAGKDGRITMRDLRGSASIMQESFAVLVVERWQDSTGHPMSTWHVDKIRSVYGAAGTEIHLYFDPVSLRFADQRSHLTNRRT